MIIRILLSCALILWVIVSVLFLAMMIHTLFKGGKNMRYAIVEDGIVTNIISMVPGTEFSGAVACGDAPVAIGDRYVNGVFCWADGPVLTPMEQMEKEHDLEMAALVEEIYNEDIDLIGE